MSMKISVRDDEPDEFAGLITRGVAIIVAYALVMFTFGVITSNYLELLLSFLLGMVSLQWLVICIAARRRKTLALARRIIEMPEFGIGWMIPLDKRALRKWNHIYGGK